ncbi:MAG TPA: carboxypeptidase-like regulatory domain-containing protein [Terriglobales bacterium]
MGAVVWTASVLLPVTANAQNAGGLSGSVRSVAGKPQMGALVEVYPVASVSSMAMQTAVTDLKGNFSISNLLPGQYVVRVSAPAFLPAEQANVALRQGTHQIVNFTLNTIFQAQQMLPAKRTASTPDDDWKWTLRSSANRSILRVLDPNAPASADTEDDADDDDGLSATLAFMAGGGFEGLGGMPSVMTNFDVEQSLGSGALGFRGNVGYGGRDPDGVIRMSYSRKSDIGGSVPEVAFTMRRSSIESPHLAASALNQYGLTFSETTKLLDVVDLKYGATLENASVIGPQVYLEPFLNAAMNIGPDGRVFYRQQWVGADDEQNSPTISLAGNGLALERARHQQAGVERRWKQNHFAVSYYRDTFSNMALTGVGQMDEAGPDSADDILAGSDLESFTANVGHRKADGVTVQWGRKVGSLDASAHYSYGSVLDSDVASTADVETLRAALRNEMRSGFGADAVYAFSKTSEIEGSYNQTLGPSLTPVDSCQSRSTAMAPYLNFRFKQPLPNFMPAHMEAVIEVRNLLAQGYRPVMGQDGRTLYLVQAPRTLRGGIAFTF